GAAADLDLVEAVDAADLGRGEPGGNGPILQLGDDGPEVPVSVGAPLAAPLAAPLTAGEERPTDQLLPPGAEHGDTSGSRNQGCIRLPRVWGLRRGGTGTSWRPYLCTGGYCCSAARDESPCGRQIAAGSPGASRVVGYGSGACPPSFTPA